MSLACSTSEELYTQFELCCVLWRLSIDKFYSYVHMHWDEIAPVPVRQPWMIWVNGTHGSLNNMNKLNPPNKTELCVYFVGYTTPRIHCTKHIRPCIMEILSYFGWFHSRILSYNLIPCEVSDIGSLGREDLIMSFIGTWTKWPTFCRQHFQLYFLDKKILYFDEDVIGVCSKGSSGH